MLFNSYAFAVFLPIVAILFYVLPVRARRGLLLAASYAFYGWWDWRFCGLVALSTVVDYRCALAIDRARGTPRARRILGVSLAINLGLLGVFKYFNFFSASLATLFDELGFAGHAPVLNVVLPVGISFYTFQTLSYTIDVYRGQKPERSWLNFANFVVFFPQLVAGPIMRANELLPQLGRRHEGTGRDFSAGAWLIVGGLLKKVVLADNLAVLVDRVYAAPGDYATPVCWLATYAYAFQIYLDFSGYTDMALGTARLFGVRLIRNFNAPYLSVGPSDFWRRWHISLSRWIRDYVYIPLGGSRSGRRRTVMALMVTMALGGLWHGAGWTFVIWGLWHGVLLVAERGFGLLPEGERGMNAGTRFLRILVMFHLVCIGWVLFRASSLADAGTMLERMFTWQAGDVIGRRFVALILLAALYHVLESGWRSFIAWRPGPVVQGGCAALAAYVLIVMAPGSAPFVYFQF